MKLEINRILEAKRRTSFVCLNGMSLNETNRWLKQNGLHLTIEYRR